MHKWRKLLTFPQNYGLILDLTKPNYKTNKAALKIKCNQTDGKLFLRRPCFY